MGDKFGRQAILPWGPRELFTVGFTGTVTGTGVTTLIAAVPGVFLDMVTLVIANTSAATSSRIDISDGTNTYAFQSIGGGAPVGFSMGAMIIPASKSGVGWTFQAASAVTDLRCFAVFVKNK